jgi:hypothetical protein
VSWLQLFVWVCYGVAIVFFVLTIRLSIQTARVNRDTERIWREIAERRRKWAEADLELEKRYPRRGT